MRHEVRGSLVDLVPTSAGLQGATPGFFGAGRDEAAQWVQIASCHRVATIF